MIETSVYTGVSLFLYNLDEVIKRKRGILILIGWFSYNFDTIFKNR
jgi:hypothetical protein